MSRAVAMAEAALAYFALAFAAGFALGLVRVPFLVPSFGEAVAIAIEVPFLLAACALAARWTTTRFRVPPTPVARLGMGGIALAALLALELGIPLLVQGQTLEQYLAARDPRALALFAGALLGFALLPALLLLRQERLFSYGTLQLESVQRATFGRLLRGAPDALVGFKLEQLAIRDPAVVATSGATHHPIVRASGDPADRVPGTAFMVTPAELARADAYEVDDYARIRVTLASGRRAWVYAAAERR